MMKQICLVLAVALLMTVGCQHHKEGEGRTTEQTIEASALPTAVVAAFNRDYPGATMKKVVKETYANGVVHYEIEFVSAAGKEDDVEYTPDGKKAH